MADENDAIMPEENDMSSEPSSDTFDDGGAGYPTDDTAGAPPGAAPLGDADMDLGGGTSGAPDYGVSSLGGGTPISPARFPPILEEVPADIEEDRNLGLLMDVTVPITAEIGRTELPLAEILRLGPGSVIELDKSADEPVDVLVNQKLLATGEVVVVGDRFGVRILDVVERGES
jgi:flagellar motor switch protein FliN